MVFNEQDAGVARTVAATIPAPGAHLLHLATWFDGQPRWMTVDRDQSGAPAPTLLAVTLDEGGPEERTLVFEHAGRASTGEHRYELGSVDPHTVTTRYDIAA